MSFALEAPDFLETSDEETDALLSTFDIPGDVFELEAVSNAEASSLSNYDEMERAIGQSDEPSSLAAAMGGHGQQNSRF